MKTLRITAAIAAVVCGIGLVGYAYTRILAVFFSEYLHFISAMK